MHIAASLLALSLSLVLTTATARADERERSEGTALTYSIGATALGATALGTGLFSDDSDGDPLMAVGAAVMVLGPSAGHWYAGELVTPALGVRAIGASIGIYSLLRSADIELSSEGGSTAHYDLLAVAGGVAYLAGAAWDIATAPRAVRRANTRALTTSLAPLPAKSGAGLALVGTF